MLKYLTVNNISEEIFILVHGLLECKYHGQQQQLGSSQLNFFFILGDSWLLVLCSWELMTGGALSLVMEAHDGWDSVCSGGLMAWLIVALWIKK